MTGLVAPLAASTHRAVELELYRPRLHGLVLREVGHRLEGEAEELVEVDVAELRLALGHLYDGLADEQPLWAAR